MIVRGTTPTHTFTLPMDCDSLKAIRVVYAQGEAVIIKKEDADLTCEGKRATCTLTQAETLSLNAELRCEIQVRVLTSDGVALAGRIIREDVGRCLDDDYMQPYLPGEPVIMTLDVGKLDKAILA